MSNYKYHFSTLKQQEEEHSVTSNKEPLIDQNENDKEVTSPIGEEQLEIIEKLQENLNLDKDNDQEFLDNYWGSQLPPKKETKQKEDSEEDEDEIKGKENVISYPVITNYQDVYESIKGRTEFVIQEEDDFIFIKYRGIKNSTFPNWRKEKDKVERRKLQLRRECRGIVFDANTGKLICRKFHKFFNINERPETNIEKINWRRPFHLVEKLDGSLVSPILLRDNKSIRFISMLGFTDLGEKADNFVFNNMPNKQKFLEFCRFCIDKHYTALFEFTTPQQRIVLYYPTETLTLLAIRKNATGEYFTMHGMIDFLKENNFYGDFPVVNFTSYPEGCDHPYMLLKEIYAKKGIEGYVIRFDDGDFYKVKTKYYTSFHGVSGGDQSVKEKQVLRAILNNTMDDFVASMFTSNVVLRTSLQEFRDEFETKLENKLMDEIIPILKGEITMDKKIENSLTGEFIWKFWGTLEKEEKKKLQEKKTVVKDEKKIIEEEINVNETKPSRIIQENVHLAKLTADELEEQIEESQQNIKLPQEDKDEEENTLLKFAPLKVDQNEDSYILECLQQYISNKLYSNVKEFNTTKKTIYNWLGVDLTVMDPYYFSLNGSITRHGGTFAILQDQGSVPAGASKKNKKAGKTEILLAQQEQEAYLKHKDKNKSYFDYIVEEEEREIRKKEEKKKKKEEAKKAIQNLKKGEEYLEFEEPPEETKSKGSKKKSKKGGKKNKKRH
ncbi:hypothetical protein ABK040_011731 [Willaertia magna]